MSVMSDLLHYYIKNTTDVTEYFICTRTQLAVQVAQLWLRDRAKLDTFSINVQRYSQNHAQNWILGHPVGH